MKVKFKHFLPFFLALILPMIIFVIAFLLLPVFDMPRSILYQDPNAQYLDFLAYFKRLVTGEENLFYSFNLSGGSETISLIAYYLFSPFNIIALFFPNDLMPYALFAIITLEIGFAGLASYYYFHKEHPSLGSYKPLIFSLGYALSAFILGYFQHFEWICPLIFFPLVCLGTNKIIRQEKPWLYIISLSATIITCYYIGFMVCIFSVLWFIYKLFIDTDKKSRKRIIKRFIISSLLAGILSAFLLIPTFVAMFSGSTNRVSSSLLSIENRASVSQLLLQLTSNQIYYSPLLFCGIIPTTLFILYFVNRKIPPKERLASFVMLFIFLISMTITIFCAIWHLGSIENGAPYRFTFIITFFLLNLGAHSLESYSGIDKKLGVIATAIFIALYAILFSSQQTTTFSNFFFLLDLIGIFITILPLFKSSKPSGKILIPLQIIGLFCFTTHMLVMLGQWEIGVYSFSITSNDIRNTNEIISKITDQDEDLDNFYRIEKTFLRTKNDSLMQNYHGLSSYSSTTEDAVLKTFIDNSAFATNIVYYDALDGHIALGSTPPLSLTSLTGIKYIITQNDLNLDSKYFKKIANTDQYSAYKYSAALPLGFVIDQSAATSEKLRPVKLINHIAGSELGENETIISDINPTNINKELENATYADSRYLKVSDHSDGIITYKINNPTKSTIYYHADLKVPTGAHPVTVSEILIKNPDTGEFEHLSHLRKGLYNLGNNEHIEIKIKFFIPDLELFDEYFFTEDESTVEKLVEKLDDQPSQWHKISSNELQGEVEVKHDAQELILSVEYDKGWQIKVDGQQIQPDKVFGNLIGIKLSKGTHNIEMKYVSPGWNLGLITSISGTVVLTIWYIIDRKSHHVK